MKISRGCKKETKRRQKASKEEENILSLSLSLFTYRANRASSLLLRRRLVIILSRLCEI
jgi:hypothetical protein